MAVKIAKKKTVKKAGGKAKLPSKSKKINWDKYFGKIEFPLTALAYQRKMRDEWAK